VEQFGQGLAAAELGFLKQLIEHTLCR